MTAKIYDGNEKSEELLKELSKETEKLETEPRLDIVLVGENSASESFISEKEKAAKKANISTQVHRLETDTSQQELENKIEELNQNSDTDGILVQLPLPRNINENQIFQHLNPEKDVDGLTALNLGRVIRKDTEVFPCTMKAVLHILEDVEDELKGKNVCIINNSNLIGKPLAMALTNRFATVNICHEHTENLEKHTENADIIITATGHPKLLEGDMIKKGSIVTDAGYARDNGKTVGDCEAETVKEKASVFTPVPGGVGPLTVAYTMKNLIELPKSRQ